MAAVGTVIAGRYRLVDQLAVGGMGSVWRAWDELLERPVAVKQLLTQPVLSDEESDTARLRIIREARITARLHHPNAVTLFDVVEDDGHPCLIMQYVPSKSLSTLLRENGPVSVGFATRIGAELAAALATAHRVGVVHRDVKPGNVLITEDGSAKLTDFGISHAVGDVTLTSTGILTGTPAFLAPEVARGEQSGFPADVFSLGATLYAALEGFPPFGTDPNPMAVLHRVASGRMLPPQQGGPLTPLLLRMLSTDPAARPLMTDVSSTLNARLSAEPGPEETRDRSTFALTVRQQPGPVAASGEPAPAVRTLLGPVPTLPPVEPADTTTPTPAANPVALRPTGVGPGPRRRPTTLLVAGAVAVLIALVGVAGYFLTRPDSADTAAGDPARAPASATAGASPPASPAKSTAAAGTRPAVPAPVPAASSPAAGQAAASGASTPARTSAATSASATPSPSTKPSERTSSERGTPTAKTTADGAAGQGGAPTAAQLTAAITEYYAAMPADTDAGWNRLTSNFQNGVAQNREYYQSFWQGIDRVTAADVSASPPDTAEATITYYFKDGRVSTERTVYTLVRDGGTVKIDNSSVVG